MKDHDGGVYVYLRGVSVRRACSWLLWGIFMLTVWLPQDRSLAYLKLPPRRSPQAGCCVLFLVAYVLVAGIYLIRVFVFIVFLGIRMYL